MKSGKILSRNLLNMLFCSAISLPFVTPAVAHAEFGKVPEAHFPNLPGKASTPEGFLTSGLKIEKLAKGDLNADTLPDLAMIIRMDDPGNLLRDPEEPEREPLDTNPRMIAVAVAEKSGGYVLDMVNMSMIPRVEDPYINDPLVDLTIEKGAIRLKLEQSSNAGSWGSANMTFVFRKRAEGIALVGYDRMDVNRASGELTETSVNFLTGQQQTSTGNISSDKKVTKMKLLPRRTLTTLGFIGDAFSFDPLNP